VYLLARYSRVFLDQYGGSRLIIFGLPPHVSIAKLFPDAPVTIVDRTGFDVDGFKQGGAQQGRIFELNYRSGLPFDGAIGRFNQERIGFARVYLREIRLSPDSPGIEPVIPDAVAEAVQRQFRELGLVEGRTAILAPNQFGRHARVSAMWPRIAVMLRQRGFGVLSNCGAEETPLEDTIPFRGDFAELFAAVSLAGTLVTARSGVCEVCCTARTRLHILQRDNMLTTFPGLTILPRLADNGLPDRAVYHNQNVQEGDIEFADRVLAHADFRPGLGA
jgi:hypothetical protein